MGFSGWDGDHLPGGRSCPLVLPLHPLRQPKMIQVMQETNDSMAFGDFAGQRFILCHDDSRQQEELKKSCSLKPDYCSSAVETQ